MVDKNIEDTDPLLESLQNQIRSLQERLELLQSSMPRSVEPMSEAHLSTYKEILDSSNLGTWEWNIETGLTKFNPRWAEILGYTLEELEPTTIKTWTRLAHPEDLIRSNLLLELHFMGETKFYDFESRMKHKNGSWVWVHDRGKVIQWKAANPVLMVGTHSDITHRRRIEQELKESELRVSLALEGAKVGIWDWDMIEDVIYYSSMYKRMLGFEMEELPNTYKAWQERWHPEDAHKIQSTMDEYLSGKDSDYEVSYRIRHKDGDYRWFLTRGTVLRNEAGQAIRWIGTNVDTTDLVKEREHVSTLQHFFDISPDLKIIINPKGFIEKANRTFETMLGYKESEVVHSRLSEFIHPDDQEKSKVYAHRTRQRYKQKPVINRLRTKEGLYRSIEWYTQTESDFIFAEGRDVTERLRIEELLKEMALSRQSIIDNIPGLIWSTHPDGSADFLNHRWLEFTGQTIEEGIGNGWLATIHPEDRGPLTANWSELVRKGEAGHFEARFKRHDGVYRTFLMQVSPYYDENAKVVKWYGTNTDITPLKESQENLAKEQNLFKATLTAVGEGILVMDADGVIRLINERAQTILGKPAGEVVNRVFNDVITVINTQSKKRVEGYIHALLMSGQDLTRTDAFSLVKDNGEEVRLSANVSVLRIQNQLANIVLSFRRLNLEDELQQEIDSLINVNIDIFCVVSAQGLLVKVNQRFEQGLGFGPDEVIQRDIMEFVHPEDQKTLEIAIGTLSPQTPINNLVLRILTKAGAYRYLSWNIMSGIKDTFYATARDVTERVLLVENLRQAAIQDELTGLFNRYYFDSIVEDHMAQSDRYDEPLSLLLLDIDHFKNVNDTWGHPVGDSLLKHIAYILSRSIRDSDILVRFGGEEFAILMPKTNLAGARIAAEKIRRAVEANPFVTTGIQTVSIGIAERLKIESFRHWYVRLDMALYKAKDMGRNQTHASTHDDPLQSPSLTIVWHHDWECGHEMIDRQHQELVSIGNQLIEASLSNRTQSENLAILDNLLTHVAAHFSYEESILKQRQYIQAEVHQLIHKELVSKALRLKEAYLVGDVNVNAFVSFVVDDVVLGHMVEEDQKFFGLFKTN